MKLWSQTNSLKFPGLLCCIFVAPNTGTNLTSLERWCESNRIKHKVKHTLFNSEMTVYCTPAQLTFILLTFC